ncbi:MAG: LacI family DNA-binding transcriptional regulator [Pseudomonadota bacterium]
MALSKATSLEVAIRAGVSRSAVSRVFTPGASASEKTVEKVRKAAKELGYRPNILARAMVSGKSRIIGLVVAYLENQFYPIALELLSNALQERGYHILIFTAQNSELGVEKVMQDLMDYQVDGIIAASVSLSSDLARRAQSSGIPVVLFNRGQDGTDFTNVTSDNMQGGRKVGEFLLAGGHKKIAHIAGWQGSTTGRDRKLGFLSVLEEQGVEPFAVVDGMYKRDVAMKCTRHLLRGSEKPDAIFVGNDHMAFGVIEEIRAFGMQPGKHISIVGYDDVPLAGWGTFDLTTVRQPVNRMVEAAVDRLLTRIDQPETPVGSILIDGDLILRGSARIPEKWTHEGL